MELESPTLQADSLLSEPQIAMFLISSILAYMLYPDNMTMKVLIFGRDLESVNSLLVTNAY